MIRLISAVAAVAISLTTAPAFAETNSTSTKPVPRTKAVLARKFSMAIIEGDRVDPKYPGFQVSDVVRAFEKATSLIKGEFESTAEFNARKATALAGKFLGGSSVEDILAFVVPVAKRNILGSLGYEFDPDTNELGLFVLPMVEPMNGLGAPSRDQGMQNDLLDRINLERRADSRKTYEASNAYGAKVTVDEITSTTLGIAAFPISFLTDVRQRTYLNPSPSTQIKMENSRAAKELRSLKAMVVMKPASPYLAYHFDHKEATRDDPMELVNQQKYVFGNVLGVVFYSGLTGEVFARLPEGFGKPAPVAPANPDVQR
jgi:hypothetical protein